MYFNLNNKKYDRSKHKYVPAFEADANEWGVLSNVKDPSTVADFLTVPVVTLNDWVQEHDVGSVAFLKVDTEGFDPEVLFGAKDVMDHFQVIAFEIHDLWDSQGLFCCSLGDLAWFIPSCQMGFYG